MKKGLTALLALSLVTGIAHAQGQTPEVFTVAYAISDDGFLNVRSQPSAKGTVLGKLWMMFHGLGSGVLREKGKQWSKVSVGEITGWVYNKYLGTQTWYDGTGQKVLVANCEEMPIYGEDYSDYGEGYPLFTTVRKGTVIADHFDEIEGYYVLTTGHDYLFIKKSDVEVRQKGGEEASLTPVYMGLWGNVGDTGFLFDMNGTTGSYIPYNMGEGKEYGERRELKLVSYNNRTGYCKINAYLKGKYIGQFEGTFEEDEVDMGDGESKTMQAYNGIFTSVKGAKLDFFFYFD